MIVRCANCHTEFSLDEHQIGPEGATVRCSVCSYVFPVDPPPGAGDHPWQIRTVEDLLFTAPDLVTLRTWIAEGRLHPDDQVSRTGRHWIRLGDMPEFSSAFSGFSDLPPVFMELETTTPASPYGSALEELGPPPGFGETMPVIQGVDTDILVVRPESIGDFEVPVTARSAAVERALERPGGPVPEPVSPLGETSQPMPFPLAELPGALDDDDDDDDEPERSDVDESAVRMRPRPPRSRPDAPTARVSAVPDVVEDVPVQSVRPRSTKATVRYGADEVHGASMLDAVTSAVDSGSGESSAVRSTAAAIERVAGRDAGPREVGPRAGRSADGERRRDRNADSEDDESSIKLRRRHRTFARDVGAKPARRTWPLVAALGVLAGVGVILGVPSIRARVMGLAGGIAGGEERFDPASLTELTKAQAAVASLDPVALGQAEAALQGRLDEGEVPPAGIAEMKLAQAELLATRALDHAVGSVIGAAAVPSDDVDRATAILAGVVAEDVIDRAHMRRVRARLRLVQGRPAAEILPLCPRTAAASCASWSRPRRFGGMPRPRCPME
ncbi:MAG: zinc-ribbon domain-containing protein [Myxococcales bacterium]|nr:zinc-ribbon domain-containing protein [Myxococcales bacterium]